ncbi:hypothetical protein BKA63DRAFT_493567 [Paraphoma chrysanthemicola]|nr:hypothetical protein BKA63DRAFT_493567 [Paraphoma chrysanthemicola]
MPPVPTLSSIDLTMDFDLSAYFDDPMHYLNSLGLQELDPQNEYSPLHMTYFDNDTHQTSHHIGLAPSFHGNGHTEQDTSNCGMPTAPQARRSSVDTVLQFEQLHDRSFTGTFGTAPVSCPGPSIIRENKIPSYAVRNSRGLANSRSRVNDKPGSPESVFFPLPYEPTQQIWSGHQHGSNAPQLRPVVKSAIHATGPFSPTREVPNILVGSVYTTNEPEAHVFRCSNFACRSKSFGRWAELKRHYNAAHAVTPVIYWCEVGGCERSEGMGDRPFPRKDKLGDHVEKIHGASGRPEMYAGYFNCEGVVFSVSNGVRRSPQQ